jgi:hypothetical protein
MNIKLESKFIAFVKQIIDGAPKAITNADAAAEYSRIIADACHLYSDLLTSGYGK